MRFSTEIRIYVNINRDTMPEYLFVSLYLNIYETSLWGFKAVLGFCRQTNEQTNEWMDIWGCRVAFATENHKLMSTIMLICATVYA